MTEENGAEAISEKIELKFLQNQQKLCEKVQQNWSRFLKQKHLATAEKYRGKY